MFSFDIVFLSSFVIDTYIGPGDSSFIYIQFMDGSTNILLMNIMIFMMYVFQN